VGGLRNIVDVAIIIIFKNGEGKGKISIIY